MKQVLLAIMLSFVSVSAFATVTPARMLIVERISTSSVNAAITSHVYKVKLGSESDCNTAAGVLNGKEVTLTILGRPVQSYTLANCAPEVQ